jgi:TolB protein
MYQLRLLLTLLFLPVSSLIGEEIIIHVSARESLVPVYVAPIQDKESELSKGYLRSLETILASDFDSNGKTALTATRQDAWILEGEIRKKQAAFKITAKGTSKGIEGVALTGDLNKDRQTLHQIHDTLFKTLFGTPGIATSRILYTVRHCIGDQADQWQSDVWEADYDGANAQQVTHDGCICVTPTFIPTKEHTRCRNFLYVSYKIGQPKIYAATVGENVGKRLTYLKGNQLMPSVAPTLDKIAFICDVTGNPDLFVQDFSIDSGLQGKPRQVFCAPGSTQGCPTFSPDGKKLAFVSNKDGTPRIYILDIPAAGVSVNSLKPRMISKKNRENTSPSWSPDGKKIAYSAMTSGTRQIWIYDLDTGEEMQLTDGSGHKENPTWAPNSLHLLFNSATPAASELYRINLNQKKAVKITSGPGEKRFPAWETYKTM